jgi:hypothetical protein
MNVEIGAEAGQFPEKEYINGIAFAAYVMQAAILAWRVLLCNTHWLQCY